VGGGWLVPRVYTTVAYIAGCFRRRWENQYRTKLRETVKEDGRQCVKVGISLNCLEEYYVCMAKSGNFPQGLVTSYKAQIRAAYVFAKAYGGICNYSVKQTTNWMLPKKEGMENQR
jgi:hypothetical protein